MSDFLPYAVPQDKPGLCLWADHNRARHFTCRACGAAFVARTPRADWCPQCRVLRLPLRREMAAKRRG